MSSALSLKSNISSLNAQRRLAANTSQLERTRQRLSSGARINTASDDAAGLAIATSLETDRRVFAQGVRNFNEGISLLNVAEQALGELSTIVVRLQELANQSGNGTLGNNQRRALDAEAQALNDEFSRIVASTSYNNLGLFNGSVQTLRFQGGFASQGGIVSALGGNLGNGSYGTGKVATGASSVYDGELGDLNGDGVLDIVSTNWDGGPTVGTKDSSASNSPPGARSACRPMNPCQVRPSRPSSALSVSRSST